MISGKQITLDFEPSLLEQFATLTDVCASAVYQSPKQLKGVASDLDVTSGMLSRWLSRPDPDTGDIRHLPADRVSEICDSTGDYRPLHWMAAKLEKKANPEAAKMQLISEAQQMMAQLNQVLQKIDTATDDPLESRGNVIASTGRKV